LDDELNIYIGNGWTSPFPSILKDGCLGFQISLKNSTLKNPPLSFIEFVSLVLPKNLVGGFNPIEKY